MNELQNKLQKLSFLLEEKKAPVLKYLNLGISKEQVLDAFLTLKKIPDVKLQTLYEWHNGVTEVNEETVRQSEIQFLPMGIFYSVSDMLKKKKEMDTWEYLTEELQDADKMIPIFGSREDDFFLYNLDTGEICYIAPSIQVYGSSRFKSLDVFIECIIECYLQKAFDIDSKEGLIEDFDKYLQIREQYELNN
jgi:hypothetical protein